MMRNRILYQFFCAIGLLSVSASCSNFLEVEEKGRTTIPAFFSDPEGLRAGLVGTYNALYDYYDSQFMEYPDVAGNMASLQILASGSDMVEQYNYTSDQASEVGAVGYIWRKIYIAQTNANNVIRYAPQVETNYPASAESCRNILGQALLIRALCHFDQCRVYAQPYNYTADASHLGVPVLRVTPGPDDNVSRNTVKEVYQQVLDDLTQASSLLADAQAADFRYASLQAVNAMFSRVYLYMEDWANALKYAKLAIGSQPLADSTAYINMYKNLSTQGEAIFRLSGEDMSGQLKKFYESNCLPADTLISLYAPNDIRLKLLMQNGARKCTKYYATAVPGNQDKRDDPFVFRLSEVYLNAAEAACHVGSYAEARVYVNAILDRAVGSADAQAVLDACQDQDLLALVQKERVKELCFEGHNLFDITRWKQNLVRETKTNSTMKRLNYPSDLFVLPIPEAELNANTNMQPNPTVNK